MKQLSKLLSIVFLMIMVFVLSTTIDASAATKKNKVTYTLSKKGTLTIKGKGEMPKKMTFAKNQKIKKVVIKKGVTSISDRAFYECKNLKSISIPKTVKKMGNQCLENTKIIKITIPNSVKTIGYSAMFRCDSLKKVTMPGNFKVNKIKMDDDYLGILPSGQIKTINLTSKLDLKTVSYFECENIKVYRKDPNYTSIDGVVYSKDKKSIVRVPKGRNEVVIAEGTENFCLNSITYSYYDYEEGYMACCSRLKKVIIPNSVKKIDRTQYKTEDGDPYELDIDFIVNSTQLDTESLATLIAVLQDTADVIDWDINDGNVVDLMAIQLPDRIKNVNGCYILDGKVLVHCLDTVKNVVVPEGVEIIGEKSFRYRYKVKKVTLPSTTKEIREKAFMYSQLNEINLEEGLVTLGNSCFENAKIKKIIVPNSVKNYGGYIFCGSDLLEASIPDDLTYIPEGMFGYCFLLTKVNVPKNIKVVKKDAFADTKIDVAEWLKNTNLYKVGDSAFASTQWQNLEIPAHLTNIGKYAFSSSYSGTKTVHILGNNFTNVKKSAFSGWYECDNEMTLNFDAGIESSFTDVDIFSKGTKKSKVEIKFSWIKVAGADGYDIRVSTDKKFKKNVYKYTAKKNENTKKVRENLKYKKTYVKIRPYKKVNGKKTYGQWSQASM